MGYNEFLAEQQRNYESLQRQQQETLRTGIEADPMLRERKGGFFLSLIHPIEVVNRVAALSRQIAELVPAVVCHPQDVHTTAGMLLDGSFGPDFYFDEGKPEHAESLKRALKVAETVAERVVANSSGSIAFNGELFVTPRVIVAAGMPDEAQVNTFELVKQIGEELGTPIKPAWGAHITISRFIDRRNREEIGPLFDLLKRTSPIGVSIPVGISAGYTLWKKSECNCTDVRNTLVSFHGVKTFLFRH